ncbi:MAG TPA: C2 family cysteine protease, partial [Magnetospirillaceae bacterium]|nr:C2 family cysteine protease [Magnetospirillaceae bacterium]
NAYYTSGKTSESGGIAALGNLKAGTTSTQLSELIGKWFLGTDMPDPTIPADGSQVPTAIYPSYTPYSYSLFGSAGVPQISDVAQGAVGDCELCAGMIETLANHPSLINSMFVNEGNGVYGVRFYVNGTETWVTVNDQLPTYKGGLVFNNAYVADPTQGLWADLLEKAYAQLSATGNIDHPAVNSYNNVSADTAFDVLTNLTDASGVQYLDSASPYWNSYKNIIINAVNQHDDVVLETGNNVKGTFDASGNEMLVANHAYAVLGYDTATGDFIVRNPWGVEYGTQGYITQFEVSMSDVASTAVQGDFAIDNSAAPNVVFTAPQLMIGLAAQTYSSFQGTGATMGAHVTASLASLFQVQDMAGQAVTQYMVQLMGSNASINLNGAANLATAAQQSAGEILVSAADLAKLTLTSGASGTDIELFLSGNDGTGMSTPFEMYWTVDSQGLTVLPTSNPMAAPSAAISLASLFQLAGGTGGSVTYTISMDAGLGSFNLNGATNLLSGSSTRIEVSAADLAKVTYSAPATSGIAVLDVTASNGSQTSDSTQVSIDVGYSVSAALSDFRSGTVPYQIGVADSAANIFGHLDALEAMMPNWNLLGVLVDDATKQTETITTAQFSADAGVLSILSGNYALDISGATVAQAQSLLGNSSNQIAAVQIADSAANIFANLSTLETMVAAGQIAGITLTDANSVAESITTAQLAANGAVLNDISSAYSLSVSGSAATVAGDLSTLQSLAAKGALGSVTLTDTGTPNLTVTAAQFTADAAALSDITSAHAVTVQMTGNAALHNFTGENWAGASALQFADQTVIVAATPGGA